MTKSPVGVEIGNKKQPKWKVGKQLGSGACSTVHVLETIDGSPTEYAIKIAPLPKKKTKKGNSKEEINANLLFYENMVYRNQVQDIQGTFIPKFPTSRGPPGHGNTEDFTFIVIEKMERPLVDLVDMLLKGRKKSAKTILFGPIAARLLSCVQAIHDRRHIVVDIKPENFMLASGDERKLNADEIASRIRILDLALVQCWASMDGHRPNEGGKNLVGTPMYSSLNVHNGETPSRRDDLEALGYLIADLIIKISSKDSSKELPWSLGKSDEEIGNLKKEYVMNPESDFYKQLGVGAAKTLSKYFSEVRNYTYKKKPDYETLMEILMELDIPVSETTGAENNSKKKPSLRPTRTTQSMPQESAPTRKRLTRSQTASTAEVSPKKVQKDDSYMDTDMVEIYSDEETFHEAQQDVDGLPNPLAGDDDTFVTAMDWESTDENRGPRSQNTKPSVSMGLTIVVEEGPHKGHTVNLVKGATESYVVGKKPDVKSGETALTLSDDDGIDDSHIRLDLCKNKKMLFITVTDLHSRSGSFVGSEKIRKGKDYRLFRGQSVRIGQSVLSVQTLDPKAATVLGSKTETSGRTDTSKPGNDATKSTTEATRGVNELPRLKRKGVQLVIVEGPHKGEKYDMEHGGIESLVFGSKPSGKTEDVVSLKNDSSLKATHIKLDLVVQKKLTVVAITDKSNGGTLVNNQVVKKGRVFINDRIMIGDTVLEVNSL